MKGNNGTGYYNNLGKNESGNHEIWLVDEEPDIIRVWVTDKGKADLRNHKNNEACTQTWKKTNDYNLIEKFKSIIQ